MKLTGMLRSLKLTYAVVNKAKDLHVAGISCNSKEIKPGFVFVAVKGVKADGHAFIGQAIANGCAAVIFDDPAASGLSAGHPDVWFIKVRDARAAAPRIAVVLYRDPSKKMSVTGVTGTNGKTTVTYLMEAVVKTAGLSPAVIGTINYRYAGRVIPSSNTTPGPVPLQELLRGMCDSGVTHVAMEVSSHALDQGRTDGVSFRSAVFTNLTRDHLDYHKTFGNYFRAKSKLFRSLGRNAVAVVNRDDPYGRKLTGLIRCRLVTYGLERGADVYATDIVTGRQATTFDLHMPRGSVVPIKVSLIGRHNVYNIMSVAAWAYASGFGRDVIARTFERFRCVPGRLEKVPGSKGYSVFVDYAHTDDALRNVISTLRQASARRIIVVFGCGGDRDRTKRPLMGKVVTEMADLAVITDDNPRSEEPRAIVDDILAGIAKDNYCIVHDRASAIRRSLRMAREGDVVLIAGKGHETYQIVKDKVLSFDDRKVAAACLRSMTY